MKSNVCKIKKGINDLDAILKESERVANYNGLSHKQALQLRLLCEEIDGMLPNIIDDFDGELWIDFNEGVCKVNVDIQIPDFNMSKKEELIKVAKNKKNSAAVGIVGKIRNAIENFFLTDSMMDSFTMSTGTLGIATGGIDGVDYAYFWRLDEYRSYVRQEDKKEAVQFATIEDIQDAINELDLSDIQDLKDDIKEIKKQLKEFKIKKGKDDKYEPNRNV